LDSPTEMSWHFAFDYRAVHVMCDPQSRFTTLLLKY
jgi:hypothetical protein